MRNLNKDDIKGKVHVDTRTDTLGTCTPSTPYQTHLNSHKTSITNALGVLQRHQHKTHPIEHMYPTRIPLL
eukprot:m.1739 g.1739  ORF g.1739 m.1739 type:complete len:71 (-) comp1963_c0_seq1:14-226(-)